jgi:2-polyprenyl-3-methyl-5-hydroxy-6-metoxy-1,4-benzoquinol methylase
MANPNRVIDKTHLSIDAAEERGLIHRDYIAHCFRWSHVVKHLLKNHAYKKAAVLDVGCGKELPLAKTLYVNKMSPACYIGVDANVLSVPDMLNRGKFPITLWGETDFCALDKEDVASDDGTALPNVVTCFEVLEHVTPEHARRMLKHFGDITSPDVDIFISTPCYNGSAAGNHINEMTFAALGAMIEDLGYKIESVYGTFASISDYHTHLNAVDVYDKDTGKVIATTDLQPIFQALRNYYDSNVLSIIFAPLFPAQARNALWHLKKQTGDAAAQIPMFSKLEQTPTPWSQHPLWRDLAGK